MNFQLTTKKYLVRTYFFFGSLLNGAPSFAEISIWSLAMTVPGLISYGEFRFNITKDHYM